MGTASEIKTKLIKPLTMQFPAPPQSKETPEEWLQTYAIILKPFDGQTLERAATLIMASRQKPTFPNAAECNSACLDAMKMLEIERRREKAPAPAAHRSDARDWQHRNDVADKLFAAHPSARLSLKEEWWWTLWSWMQTSGRSPDPHETLKIKTAGMAGYERLQRDLAGNAFARSLTAWRQKAKTRISALLPEPAHAG
jgi:hypothetical protein